MIARHLFLPLVLLLIAITGCGGVNDSGEPGGGNTDTQSAAARQISGNWRGTLHQAKLPPFQIAVNISATNTAQVAYTGIKCGGEWTLDQVQAPSPGHFIYVFTERINQGAGGSCKGTGKVSVSPIQRQIPNEPAYQQMRYRFSGGGVTSRGLIHRTDPEHIHSIFKRAGVPAPPG